MSNYETELQKIAADVQKVHPIGEVTSIGLMETHHACRELFEELLQLRHWRTMSDALSQACRETEEHFSEDSLECSCCLWRGRESDCTILENDDDELFACPECGEECAHVPMDEWTI